MELTLPEEKDGKEHKLPIAGRDATLRPQYLSPSLGYLFLYIGASRHEVSYPEKGQCIGVWLG